MTEQEGLEIDKKIKVDTILGLFCTGNVQSESEKYIQGGSLWWRFLWWDD